MNIIVLSYSVINVTSFLSYEIIEHNALKSITIILLTITSNIVFSNWCHMLVSGSNNYYINVIWYC